MGWRAAAGTLAALAALTGCTEETKPALSPALARIEAARPRIAAAVGRGSRPQDPRLAQAYALMTQNRAPEAHALIAAVEAEHPDDLAAVLYEGLVLKEEKRYQEARTCFERILDGSPAFPRAFATFYYYGWCLYNLGEPDAAKAAFEAYLAFDADEGDAYFGIGLVDLDAGRLDDAAIRFQRAIDLGERGVRAGKKHLVADVAKAYARLADVAFQRDRFEEAKALLEECLARTPDAHEAWYLLHRTLKRLGDDAGAAHALERHEATKPKTEDSRPPE